MCLYHVLSEVVVPVVVVGQVVGVVQAPLVLLLVLQLEAVIVFRILNIELFLIYYIKACSSATDLTPWSSDCTQFQRCANGITYVFSCGPGTVFNPTLKVCDWPYNVPTPCAVGGSSSTCTTVATVTVAPTTASSGGGSAVAGARKNKNKNLLHFK